jgi:hypothetical protein
MSRLIGRSPPATPTHYYTQKRFPKGAHLVLHTATRRVAAELDNVNAQLPLRPEFSICGELASTDAPFPQAERCFLVEWAAELLESPADLAAVVGLVGDHVPKQRRGVRLESSHPASRRNRLTEQTLDRLTRSVKRGSELGLPAAFLCFQLLQAF